MILCVRQITNEIHVIKTVCAVTVMIIDDDITDKYVLCFKGFPSRWQSAPSRIPELSEWSLSRAFVLSNGKWWLNQCEYKQSKVKVNILSDQFALSIWHS